MKSISDRDVIFHRRLGNIKDITFDHNKPKKKKPKNRAPITTVELTRRSTLSIRVFLREFCVQLLENCYNPLMYAVKVRPAVWTVQRQPMVTRTVEVLLVLSFLGVLRFSRKFSTGYILQIAKISQNMIYLFISLYL